MHTFFSAIPLFSGIFIFSCEQSLHAQDCCTPEPPLDSKYCEKTVTAPKYDVKAAGLFKTRTGNFCQTPEFVGPDLIVYGCSDGLLYYYNLKSGQIIKTVNLINGLDLAGMTPEINAVVMPKSSPPVIVATLQSNGIIHLLNKQGQIIKKITFGNSLYPSVVLPGGGVGLIEDAENGYAFHRIEADGTKKTFNLGKIDGGYLKATRGDDGGDYVYFTGGGHLRKVNVLTGEMKSVEVVKKSVWLSSPQVAPDGRIWVSDLQGNMMVVGKDMNKIESTVKISNGIVTGVVPGGRYMSVPTFTSDDKAVFTGDRKIYIYSASDPQKMLSVTDINKTNALTLDFYIGGPLHDNPVSVVRAANGKEMLWVGSYGGYSLYDLDGRLSGEFSFRMGLGDAECFSPATQMSNGMIMVGHFNGVERYTIKPSAVKDAKMKSAQYLPCQ